MNEMEVGAEEALRNAARQWQAAFDALGDPVFLLDADRRICRSNKAAQVLFGRSGAEMEGCFCHEVVHGTAAPIAECPVFRLRGSLRREAVELAIGDRCFYVTVDPLTDAAGNLSGVVHIVNDITEAQAGRDGPENGLRGTRVDSRRGCAAASSPRTCTMTSVKR